MTSKRLVLFINKLTTALFLRYANKTVIRDSADLVEHWSCNIDMRINTTKTKNMVLCFRRSSTFVASLPHNYMNGIYIEIVPLAKIIGVTISSDLCWNVHVDETMS